jgi:hypothetical protein
MEFKFENILLPDSNTNEPLSHGFVRYRIQPKTNSTPAIPSPTSPPFTSTSTNPSSPTPLKPSSFSPPDFHLQPNTRKLLHVFPNPAENSINISGIQLENGKAQLRLTDIYGKLILEKTITKHLTTTLEVDQLSKGVYLIQSGG